MARMIRAKLTVELREQGAPKRPISSSRHMTMESVSEIFDITAGRQVVSEQVSGTLEDEVYSTVVILCIGGSAAGVVSAGRDCL